MSTETREERRTRRAAEAAETGASSASPSATPFTSENAALIAAGHVRRDDNNQFAKPPGTAGGCNMFAGNIPAAEIVDGIHVRGCGFIATRHPNAPPPPAAGPDQDQLCPQTVSPAEALRLNIQGEYDLLKSSPSGSDVMYMSRLRQLLNNLQTLSSNNHVRRIIHAHFRIQEGWTSTAAIVHITALPTITAQEQDRLNDHCLRMGECAIAVDKIRSSSRTSVGGPEVSTHVCIVGQTLVKAEAHVWTQFLLEMSSATGGQTTHLFTYVDIQEFIKLMVRHMDMRTMMHAPALWWPSHGQYMKNVRNHLISNAQTGLYVTRSSAQHLLNQLTISSHHPIFLQQTAQSTTTSTDGTAPAAGVTPMTMTIYRYRALFK
jgi:hypothetical protein